jgi:5-methylcytosine-specific restriction protein A
VEYLLGGGDAPAFAPSRDFDLVAPDGTRLAPKKVFGVALRAATGVDARPEHFTAGLGTPCFQALEAAGYPVIRKGESIPGGGVDPVDPDLAAAEGQPRLVAHLRRERRPALAAAKRRGLVPSLALGPHGDAVIEIHHTGTQVAEMGAGHVTRLADLVCLCANCHRIVHRELAA